MIVNGLEAAFATAKSLLNHNVDCYCAGKPRIITGVLFCCKPKISAAK